MLPEFFRPGRRMPDGWPRLRLHEVPPRVRICHLLSQIESRVAGTVKRQGGLPCRLTPCSTAVRPVMSNTPDRSTGAGRKWVTLRSLHGDQIAFVGRFNALQTSRESTWTLTTGIITL